MRYSDEFPEVPMGMIEVLVEGKVKLRPIDGIDLETGHSIPRLRDGEEVFRTISGDTYLVKTR